ncbi:MAG: glycosyltransferase family 2 protein [Desulfobacteraceae bacterium]|nr:glycosyltransferase family 2 protein [Desulfobacteraceae bacterium]
MREHNIEISVVVPVYSCRECLYDLVERLNITLSSIVKDWEIILVNDACPQGSWEEIKNISDSNAKVIGINLSRNFGQHYAITAGLDHTKGEWVVVMDCDLQDKPEEISKLYAKTQEGYDIVYAQRVERKDTFCKKISSKIFYSILGYLSDTKQDSTIANFGVYNKKAIKAILDMGDYIRYFPTMSQWVGFNKTTMLVEHSSRKNGKSSYSFKKLFDLALNNMITFSDKPLRLTIKAGLLMVVLSILIGSYYFFKHIHGDIYVLGYASLIISIWFLAGCTLLILGIVGLYVGKTFEKVKNRPLYIIDEKVPFDEE